MRGLSTQLRGVGAPLNKRLQIMLAIGTDRELMKLLRRITNS
jgi:hypothetical protein